MIETTFINKKKNIFSVSAEQLVESNTNNEENSPDTEPTKQVDDDKEISMLGLRDVSQNNRKKNLLFINESLTHTNRVLLREARSISKQLNYKFTGYTVNGEVRVKKN